MARARTMAGSITSISVQVARLGWTLGLAVLTTPALGADYRTVDTGAPMCSTLEELRDYLPAIVGQDMPTLNRLQNCVWLKGGVAVDITKTYMDFGAPPHPVGIRMFGNGTFADGFTFREGLESAK